MSTFRGKVAEYKLIAIDNFESKNYDSTVYFLSHCHKDHMVGLSSPKFLQRLKSSFNVKLYMSDISRILLLNDPTYRHLSPYLVCNLQLW
ncbi:protein artemis-like [Limulus polyphemus]|uniref:Protein artemis-like n=1 Tax=Limulus polyphemus TaxID=6850 RepID=A0ABM1BY23_LIMPO|nr:protein artemis-like [Limulus polyphemus]